jgi:hypothetical protein
MKILRLPHKSFWWLGLALTILFTAFVRQDGLEAVLSAMKTGNATALAVRLQDNIKLTLPDQTGTLPKSQAQTQLAKFFSANSVKGFELKHKGGAPGAAYAIGTLQTQQGDFRVNVFLTGKGSKELVRELRIQNMD